MKIFNPLRFLSMVVLTSPYTCNDFRLFMKGKKRQILENSKTTPFSKNRFAKKWKFSILSVSLRDSPKIPLDLLWLLFVHEKGSSVKS